MVLLPGDKILFSFQEVNNKELEVIEYPFNSKFSDYISKKSEKSFYSSLLDKTLRVPSQTNLNSSPHAYADVELPKNTTDNLFNPYKSTELIGWSYWIGVGQKSMEEYQRINKNMSAGDCNLMPRTCSSR